MPFPAKKSRFGNPEASLTPLLRGIRQPIAPAHVKPLCKPCSSIAKPALFWQGRAKPRHARPHFAASVDLAETLHGSCRNPAESRRRSSGNSALGNTWSTYFTCWQPHDGHARLAAWSVFISHISASKYGPPEARGRLRSPCTPTRARPLLADGPTPAPGQGVALRDIQSIGRDRQLTGVSLHVSCPTPRTAAGANSRPPRELIDLSAGISSALQRGRARQLARALLRADGDQAAAHRARQARFELCGTYGIPTVALVPTTASSALSPRLPSARFIEAAGDMPGTVKARKALRFIASGSASPMETCMVMLLCLPLRLGGYNLPKPQMNREVRPKRRGRLAPGTGSASATSSGTRPASPSNTTARVPRAQAGSGRREKAQRL